MAKNKTEKCRWYSKRADAYIADGQYLAEFICERLAQRKNLNIVGKFWNHEAWNKTYKQQLQMANKLLKLYSAEAILAALKSKDGAGCWSLNAQWLPPIVAREQLKYDTRMAQLQEEEDQTNEPSVQLELFPSDSSEQPRKKTKGKGLLANLREIEEKEQNDG